MEMAQLIRLSLALLCCSVVVLSTETSENNYNDVVQFILNWYNGKSDSQHVYNSAKILNAYKKNDSEPLYLLQLEVVTICNSSQNCHSSALICEVGVRENLSSHSKEVLTDRAKCVKKEIEPVIPSFGHGFVEENITDEIRSIAAFAIQQSQSNGANKRSVIDIMSVKRQVVGNATTLYLTLKVTKNEGGDAVQFEICEAEVNQTGEMAWESSLSCFPLNGLSSETPINAEDITTVAERAADEMDSLSFSEFTLKLMDVLKAETTVTPGSEGTMTNLELRLTPTVCLKNVDVENDAYGLYSNRLCPENNTNKRLVCSLTSWDRPWVDDTLYSEPSCRIETPIAISNQTQSTNTHAIQNDSPDVMMNDEMEPENEEVFIPAVEHHSIPMVEELDPIIEQILPDIEKPGASEVEEPLIPVVEEPIVAKHVYCTGCPIDLDVNNPALDEFVEQALASIDDSSNGQNMYRATRITKAQKQVVNGVKYILHLEVAETICRKDSGHNRGTCETSNNEIKTCIVEFLEKPWIDSSRVIVSNNCTRYNNDLENEIKPHFVSHSHLARQEIFDYLDEMEEPKPIPNSEDFPSYGKDSLYPPESEPTNHPLERDAEEIEIKTTADEHRKSEKAVMESSHASSDVDRKTESPAESEESKESEENQTEKHTTVNNSGESDESSEESKENQEEKLDKIAAYISNENRNRRETSLTTNFGALKEIGDSEKELANKLAEIAVNTLDEIDEDDKKRVVLEILSAHKQIVNGMMYHLLLRIVSTSCSELGHSDPSCVNEQLSPVRICKVELHRSFASNSQLDAKVVKSECTVENENASEKKLRRKRDVSVVTGVLYPANTSEPYITQMADFAVTELDKCTNSLYRQCIIRIDNASKQVVAGYNIYLTLILGDSVHRKGENISGNCQLDANVETRECQVTIWHRPWIENSQRVTSFNCSSNEVRSKRETSETHHRLIGGPIDADTNDTYIQELAGTALEEVNRRSNGIYEQKTVRIIEAKTQVVSGVKVRLTMEFGYTNCRKGSEENKDCQLNENSNNQICYIEIWDRSWLSDRRVTNFSCSPAASSSSDVSPTTEPSTAVNRKKRHIPGGHTTANTSDPYIQEIAGTALLEVDRRSNALHKQQIVNIISATKQVVAGLNVHLVMELGYTTCRKGTNETESCPLSENSNNQICHVVVWDRPWLQDRRVTNISCSAVSDSVTITSTNTERSEELTSAVTRKKRDTLGGHTAANTSDPYIQEIAGTALLEVDRRSNALHKQQIVNIISATKQVVAGLKIHLVMELGYTTCRKGGNATESCPLSENSNNQICHMEVWDRPWLQDRRVTNISCSAVADSVTISSTNTELSDELETTNRLKRHVGGFSKVEVDDPYVLQMAKTVLVEYDKKSNALFKQKIIRIIEAQRQVVAGTLTRLTIEIGYSKCRKGHEVDVETCELRENSKNQICHVEVWDRPWLNKREIKKSSCNPSISTRSKRKSLKHDFQVEAFQNFIEKYNKKYSSNAEYKQRFHIFRANLKKIDLLQRTEQGTATYGITQFADLSKREFKKYHLGLNRNLKDSNEIPMQEAVIPNVELLKEFDWRHYNAVTEVKNQGSCGSCWAFSVTGNIEGQWKINKGKLVSLSEQELVDCDTLDDGCNGGLPENAYKAIEKLGGLETEGDYPYEGDDEKCHFKKSDVKVTIQGSVNITKNETKMAQWLYKNGPMSIGINANAMQFYMGGVSHPWKFLCNGDDLDHGVLIVGYGVHTYPMFHKVLPFWIIKNSWGALWGEQGYYRVYRGDGTCGVNQMVTSAIVG